MGPHGHYSQVDYLESFLNGITFVGIMSSDLCSIIRKEFNNLIDHSLDIQLAYYRPISNSINRARLRGFNFAAKNLLNLELLVHQLFGASFTELPVKTYLSELNDTRNRAVRAIQFFDRYPDEVQSWITYYEKNKGHVRKLGSLARATDIAGIAVSAWLAMYLDEQGYSAAFALGTSALLYTIDFLRKKRKTDSFERVGAYVASTIPALGALAAYLVTHDANHLNEARDLSIAPVLLYFVAILPPSLYSTLAPKIEEGSKLMGRRLNSRFSGSTKRESIADVGDAYAEAFSRRKFSLNLYNQAEVMATARNSVGDFFDRTKRLTYTLSEIRRVQLLPHITEVPAEMIDKFEQACAAYLRGGQKEDIRLKRKRIKDHIIGRYTREEIVAQVNLVDRMVESETAGSGEPSKLEFLRPELDLEGFKTVDSRDLEIYALARHYGADEKNAVRISRRAIRNDVLYVVARTTQILGEEGAEQVLKINPQLLLMKNPKKNPYFGALASTWSWIQESFGEATPVLYIKTNPYIFSSLEGLLKIRELATEPKLDSSIVRVDKPQPIPEVSVVFSQDLTELYTTKSYVGRYPIGPLMDLTKEKIERNPQGELIRDSPTGQYILRRLRDRHNLAPDVKVFKMQPKGGLRALYTRQNGGVKVLEILTHGDYDRMMKK